MGAASVWIKAARPRTLPAALAPIAVGTCLAAGPANTFKPLILVAAVVGALFIQIGTNLSNDYSDARRGADTEDRLGPVRVTAGGLVPPRYVLYATWASFVIAVAAGGYLIYEAGWELLAVGAASIVAGVLYTGGPRPYGYEGLGEIFVFLFFGVVAVMGSFFVQTEQIAWEAFALSVPVGLLACAVLMVNNIRDLDTDRRAGKRTLAVRLGRGRMRRVFAITLYVSFALVPLIWLVTGLTAWINLALLALPLAPSLARTVRDRTDGGALNTALGDTARMEMVFCVLLALGLMLPSLA
ncbi:MAG: 1,4-dihydroxy-2-naphthoate polyprenyltransferase [Actinobacteria bacterium]|nr:1,4-dihydroxy-2-naphthoate polyprenyltransferase [Actinomycetota bacterium]